MRGRGCHASGRFRWRCFLRVHAIVCCISDGSGTCHLLITQRDHLWFLHVSTSYWTTCRVPIVPRVSFLLAHVSGCGWIMCQFFIGPCVVFLLVHVVISYSTTSHGVARPHFVFLFGHVVSRPPSMCRISIAQMSCPCYSTCHALVRPRVVFLYDHMVCPGSTSWSTINSS
jgi:hypothetical protein